jgi:short-subunit dehydrogenase
MRLGERHRNALVTGAGSGLGAAFADMLLAENIRVWGTSRDPSRFAARSNFSPLALELSDAASIERSWADAQAASGGIDLLINNAGDGVFGSSVDLSSEVWERQIEVLFFGPARLARLAFAAMHARGSGAIVNVSSLAAEFPIPFMSGYNAGKAALSAWTASLVLETTGSGVTVVDFRPGDLRTNFNSAMISRQESQADASPRAARVWARLEAALAASPEPALAARDLRRALVSGRSGVVRSGSFFQARVAPLLQRLAPQRLSARVRARYFHAD